MFHSDETQSESISVDFMQRGPVVIVLLCGGDKRTQAADIKRAVAIAKDWQD